MMYLDMQTQLFQQLQVSFFHQGLIANIQNRGEGFQ